MTAKSGHTSSDKKLGKKPPVVDGAKASMKPIAWQSRTNLVLGDNVEKSFAAGFRGAMKFNAAKQNLVLGMEKNGLASNTAKEPADGLKSIVKKLRAARKRKPAGTFKLKAHSAQIDGRIIAQLKDNEELKEKAKVEHEQLLKRIDRLVDDGKEARALAELSTSKLRSYLEDEGIELGEDDNE